MEYSEENSQRIQDCGELYLKHGGKRHAQIEKDMRALGHRDFHRRVLYRRFERGTCRPGWIETYGWDGLIKANAYRTEIERHAAAQSSPPYVRSEAAGFGSPPYEGGVAAASADGVVLSSAYGTSHEPTNHHAAFAPPVMTSRVPLTNDFEEFTNWLKQVSPEKQWEFKHQIYIYKHLKRLTDGEIKRLMIFMPPRHGKSEMVTVRYAAWRLKQDPAMNVIIASYNQELANRFSRKIKRVLCDDAMSEPPASAGGQFVPNTEVFSTQRKEAEPHSPNVVEQKPRNWPPANAGGSDTSASPFPFVSTRPKNTEAEWETSVGGGLRAVGVGSGVTGFGANLIIIDDPVKSRAEAESKTFRERLWNWFNDDIRTRLEPDGSIVLIQTRWHEDDLAGRLLREAKEEGGEQWTVVNLPAIAEEMRKAECGMRNEETGGNASVNERAVAEKEMENEKDNQTGAIPHSAFLTPHSTDPLGRSYGQALWPERFPEPLLDKLQRQMGSYSFASLYQQRPTPAEGGLFKRAWFKIVNTPPPNLRWTRGYDLGISKNATADYTASVRVAFDDNQNMYIDGGYRARIEYPEQRRYILGRINSERDTAHGIELSANGNAVIQDLRKSRLTQGRALRGIQAKGDKVTNALSWIALAEEGHVHLVRGPWNKDFIEEAAAFPLGTHDDQIDAVSLALRLHRERGYRSFGF